MSAKPLESRPRNPLEGQLRPAKMIDLSHISSSRRTARSPFPATPGLRGEVHSLATKPILKFGIVTFIHRVSPQGKTYWQGRFKVDGRDMRIRVAGDLGRDALKEMAQEWTRQAYAEKGHFRRKDQPSVEQVFAECLRLTNTLPITKHDRAQHAARFCRWLAEKHPSIRRWEQLRPAIIQSFAQELEGRGLAYDSVRLALAPIKLAWRFATENWPEIRPLPRIKLSAAPRREIDNLEPNEVRALLDWLRENATDVWPLATLQALTGLRLLEAASVRRQDVDLEAGTLAVVSTEHHRLKTPDSHRILPLCAEAHEALRIAIENQKVVPPGGELFVNQRGNLWTKDALGGRWERIRQQIAATPGTRIRSNGRRLAMNKNGLGLIRIAEVPAKRLRSSFGTMASRLGIPDHLIRRYIGHVATDTFGKHYLKITLDDLRTVSERMNGWRQLTDHAPAWQNRGNSGFAQGAEG